MKKIAMISLTLILFWGLFTPAISLTQVKGSISEGVFDSAQFADANADVRLNVKVALSDEVIKSSWPNLPTAKELWNSEVRCWIDTRDFGKLDTSKEALSLPYAEYMNDARVIVEPITNFTCDVAAMLTGGILQDVPHIWLQYNETIWVQVPINLLMVTKAATPAQQVSTVTTTQTGNIWALGLYANPAQIAGGNTVYGSMSFGAWGNYNPALSTEYHYSDVLTVHDGVYQWQVGMGEDIYGKFVEMQGWLGSSMVYNYNTRPAGTIEGNLYNEYIRYNPQYSAWEFYWNFQQVAPRLSDGQTCILTGNQPNVCVESNDWNSGHFSSYSTTLGGIVNNQYWAAVGYLFNGNWVPFNMGDPVPSAYVYHGGSSANVIFRVCQYNAPYWIGETSPGTERLTIGYGINQPAHGTQLW